MSGVVLLTCAGVDWPDLYVMCEGTVSDIRDGIVTCYPYDAFES